MSPNLHSLVLWPVHFRHLFSTGGCPNAYKLYGGHLLPHPQFISGIVKFLDIDSLIMYINQRIYLSCTCIYIICLFSSFPILSF
jgi:hypothetical protein